MKKIIVLVGPTATGKTALSIKLAKVFSGEIINADSVQFYHGMNIGTAKITQSEMEDIPHHLLNCRMPDQHLNVFEFKELAAEKISEISARGKIPILVGGTGLYLQSLLYDYSFPETCADAGLRKQLTNKSPEKLYQQLQSLDPQAAEKIHQNNSKRVIRALEVILLTGEKFSKQVDASARIAQYDATVIGLTMERANLYERINQRVEDMIANGLEQEVRQLYLDGYAGTLAIQAIGYKEFHSYFTGEISLAMVIQQIQQNSRRFAKRQLTWFRNKMDVTWFDMTEIEMFETKYNTITEFISQHLKK